MKNTSKSTVGVMKISSQTSLLFGGLAKKQKTTKWTTPIEKIVLIDKYRIKAFRTSQLAIKHKPRSVSRDIYETMITMYIKTKIKNINKKQNKKYVKTNNTKQNKTKQKTTTTKNNQKKTNKQADDRLNRADLNIEQGIK